MTFNQEVFIEQSRDAETTRHPRLDNMNRFLFEQGIIRRREKMKKTISLPLVLALCMVAKADFTFGESMLLSPEVNTGSAELSPAISADGQSLYFSSMRSGGFGQFDLWLSKRQSSTDTWGKAVNLGPAVNSPAYEANPSISSDGLTLFFSDSIPGFISARTGGYGDGDLWFSSRLSEDSEWGIAENVGPPVNTSFREEAPYISSDGLSLFFSSDRDGGYGRLDIWVATRQTKESSWNEPINMGPLVNSPNSDDYPCLSPDSLCLIFSSIRPPSQYWDIWFITRKNQAMPWKHSLLLEKTINSQIQDFSTAITPDGSSFYYASRISGFMDIFKVPIIPIVDLNNDGIVDSVDMVIMVDHWGTDNSLCDIGPMPWGDGVVDVEDLIVLAEHLFEEVPKPPGRPGR